MVRASTSLGLVTIPDIFGLKGLFVELKLSAMRDNPPYRASASSSYSHYTLNGLGLATTEVICYPRICIRLTPAVAGTLPLDLLFLIDTWATAFAVIPLACLSSRTTD